MNLEDAMRLHYKGKYSGDENTLPQPEHKPGAVRFKEPENPKKLAIYMNVVAIIMYIIIYPLLILHGGTDAFSYLGCLLGLLAAYPHEFLHAICFKKDAYIYNNLKQGMLFVVGPEDMSKARFVFMSLLPNIVFGFIPFIIFWINPSLGVLGSIGAISIPMGAGDYLNVVNAITQMPKGARTYLSGFHSYWYMPE